MTAIRAQDRAGGRADPPAAAPAKGRQPSAAPAMNGVGRVACDRIGFGPASSFVEKLIVGQKE
ncbi:MAG: hypothetical protein V3U93_09525 [Alphaproteobacteria bacterium]